MYYKSHNMCQWNSRNRNCNNCRWGKIERDTYFLREFIFWYDIFKNYSYFLFFLRVVIFWNLYYQLILLWQAQSLPSWDFQLNFLSFLKNQKTQNIIYEVYHIFIIRCTTYYFKLLKSSNVIYIYKIVRLTWYIIIIRV